jgi:hypothetical protein
MTPHDVGEVRLSSPATVWYRWGIPAVAVLIGLKVISVIRALSHMTVGLLISIVGLVILAVISRRALLLADVLLRGDSLEIRQIGCEFAVPLTAVRVLDEGTWWSSIIVLGVQDRQVPFMPRLNSAGLLPESDDSVIRELRRRLG